MESLAGALGVLGAVREVSWEVLGRSCRHIRGVLEALWVVLEPSWELWKPCWSDLGAKRFPKEDPKRVQNLSVFGIDFEIDFGCVLGTPKS